MVEVDVGLMCGCMPLFGTLFTKGKLPYRLFSSVRSMGSRLLSTTRRSGGSKGSNGGSGSGGLSGFKSAGSKGSSRGTNGADNLSGQYIVLNEGKHSNGGFRKSSSTMEEEDERSTRAPSTRSKGARREWYDSELNTMSSQA